MKFYKRDPDRALSGMAELTMKQRGAYNSLIDLLYSRDGKVLDDDFRVAKMLNYNPREWGPVKRQLIAAGKVWIEDGYLQCKRVRVTLEDAVEFGLTQSQRALNGWDKRRKQNEINATAMPMGNTTTATATPIEESKKKKIVVEKVVSAKGKNGTRWPTDAVVSQDWIDDAARTRFNHDMPEIDLAVEATKFANYWTSKSGASATKLDWHKTWINWTLKSEGNRNGYGKPTKSDNELAGARAAAGYFLAQGRTDQGGEDGGDAVPGHPALPPV